MTSVLNQILEVIGPSIDVVYTLGQMSDSSNSSGSVMPLDVNLVREDSPDSAQSKVPVRWDHFTDLAYVAKRAPLTLSRSILEDLRNNYQIPKSVSPRVSSFDEWACSYDPNEVAIF